MKHWTLALATEVESESDAKVAGGGAGALHDTDTMAEEGALKAGPPAPAKFALVEVVENIDWLGLTLSWSVRALSLVAGIVIWQLACAYKFKFFINFENVPSPLVVLSALLKHAHETTFYIHIFVSLKRILIGFALATTIGVILGVVMGRSKIARDVVTPYIEILLADPGRSVDSARHSYVADRGIFDHLYHVPGRAIPDRAQHRTRRRTDP